MVSIPEIGRILSRVQIRKYGCWFWTGRQSGGGYGQVGWNGGQHPAHRVVYEIFVEAVPADWELHHLCGKKLCVRPDHLQPLTVKDHVAVTAGPFGDNSRKTACDRGHPFTPENTYLWNDHRHCRQCSAIRSRAARARAKTRAATQA